MPRRNLAILAMVGAALLCSVAAPATAQEAPSGPPLREPTSVLAAALRCDGDLRAPGPVPVLLVPGTALDPDEYDWNYRPALRAAGHAVCSVALVDHSTGDIQLSAERIVYAIRTMHDASGRRISLVGHSQGGMAPRWALRFWPDIRAMVDDLVALAGSNHGTIIADPFCIAGCAAAIHQQQEDSAFLAALNRDTETVAGVSYTSVYTHFDQIVVPNQNDNGSTALRTGPGARTNVAVQDVCPLHAADHLSLGTVDAVGYALAIDALNHEGPARPERLEVAVCAQPWMPAVDPVSLPANTARLGTTIATSLAGAPILPAEPPLQCYATGSCPVTPAETAPPDVPVPGGSPLPATGARPSPLLAGALIAGATALLATRRRHRVGS